MPDFTQPRMKKPDVALVNQENGRTIVLRLSSMVFFIQRKRKEKKIS